MNLRTVILCLILTNGVTNSICKAQPFTISNSFSIQKEVCTNGWLQSGNASGLTTYKGDNQSAVSLYGTLQTGDFKDYYQSALSYSSGAITNSYHRISNRTLVYGEMSYRNTRSQKVAGSYFINPTVTPFDLLEINNQNKGDKQLEEYHLKGRIGTDVNQILSLGAEFDYTTANYTKKKDLRHINSLMDLSLTLGGKIHLSERVDIGAHYAYRRRNETLLLSVYGTTDQTFTSLLSYGAFFGKQEVFGEVGYTKDNEKKPLFDEYHGGGLQIEWDMAAHLKCFHELEVRFRNGHYGDHSPATVVYAEHKGTAYAYSGLFSYQKEQSIHSLRLSIDHDKVKNMENIHQFKNTDEGLSYIEYSGVRESGKRTTESLSILYSGFLSQKKGLPLWIVKTQLDYTHRKILASNYPEYRRQDIVWWNLSASVGRNFRTNNHILSVTLNTGYGQGHGNVAKDGEYTTSNTSETLTYRQDNLLMQEYEYHTTPRFYTGIGCKYIRPWGKRGMQAFVCLNYDFTKAPQSKWLGNAQCHTLQISLGCGF